MAKAQPIDHADSPEQKAVIGYHRAHRRVTFSRRILLGAVTTLAVTLAVLGAKIYFMPELTLRVYQILQPLFAAQGLHGSLVEIPLWGDAVLSVLYARPAVPSRELCLVVAGGGAFLLATLHRLPLPRPVVIIVNLLSFMVAFYAGLFLLLPGFFNESTQALAEFFMEISLITGLALPALFWLVLFPLPAGVIWKLLSILALEAVLFGLFWLKCVFFVILCARGTYLIAPLVIFFLCSTLDILYMIMLFSLTVSRVSRAVAKDVRVWQWA